MTKLDLYNQCRANIENVYQIVASVFKEPFVELTINNFKDIANEIPRTLAEASTWMNTNLIGSIVVHFPKVTVENEYGKTHDIYDLFVKFEVNGLGHLEDWFYIKRTSFTVAEMKGGYVHSHTPRKFSEQSIRNYDYVCLGSGPIRNTIYRLNQSNNEDLWLLFCNELSMYVRTESITGGPYIGMSELAEGDDIIFKDLKTTILTRLPSDIQTKNNIKRLIELLLDRANLKFSYYKGRYCLGETFNDIVIKTSEFAEKLFPVVMSVTFDGRLFHKDATTNNEIPLAYRQLIGQKAFDFKGKEIKFKIANTEDKTVAFKIIHPDYLREALNIILLLLNNYYNGEHNGRPEEHSGRTEQETSSENRKHIKYLFR